MCVLSAAGCASRSSPTCTPGRIVGRQTSTSPCADLAASALEMAVWARRREGADLTGPGPPLRPRGAVSLSHQNWRLRAGDRRDGAGRMGAEWVWRTWGPHRPELPRAFPRHHVDPGQSGGLPGEKGSVPGHPLRAGPGPVRGGRIRRVEGGLLSASLWPRPSTPRTRPSSSATRAPWEGIDAARARHRPVGPLVQQHPSSLRHRHAHPGRARGRPGP